MLNLGEASAALVCDTSISGITSPIRGSRYRLELSQSAGSLTYTGVTGRLPHLLDAVPKPYTFAFRGMYYGRLRLGCGGLPAADVVSSDIRVWCAATTRIVSNRASAASDRHVVVPGCSIGCSAAAWPSVNAELRFPLWSAFGGDNFYGPLPVEMALFADSGVAWGTGTVLGITDSGVFGQVENKEPVASVGVAMRANLFGFAVAEIDYVRPLDRPGRGWVWQFNLRPGF